MVRRRAAHRARRRVRHQARAGPRRAGLVGRDLLRARERPGLLPAAATTDADAIGVRALDDRTVEFRLVAPAPYFMSVMNRPDGGPQPRHAIERDGDAWTDAGSQVVSGAFRIAERTDDLLVLERQPERRRSARRATSRGSSTSARRWPTRVEPYARDELDMVTVRYTPRLADLVPGRARRRARSAPAAWSGYFAFDHAHPGRCRTSTSAARSRTRSTARRSERAVPDEHGGRRPAGSCRPRSRATRPTSSCGSTRTWRARTSRRPASRRRADDRRGSRRG